MNKINGTPWGIVYLETKDKGYRHKARCAYLDLDKKTCSLIGKCCGSSQCDFYREIKKVEVLKPVSQKTSGKLSPVNVRFNTVGTRIYHKATYSSNDGGFGTITAVMYGKIRIDFDDGSFGYFTFPDCMRFLIIVNEE